MGLRTRHQILAQQGPTEGRRCWGVTAGGPPAQVRWVWQSPLTLTFWVSWGDSPATLSPGSSPALGAASIRCGALNSEQPLLPKPSGGLRAPGKLRKPQAGSLGTALLRRSAQVATTHHQHRPEPLSPPPCASQLGLLPVTRGPRRHYL